MMVASHIMLLHAYLNERRVPYGVLSLKRSFRVNPIPTMYLKVVAECNRMLSLMWCQMLHSTCTNLQFFKPILFLRRTFIRPS